MSTQNSEIPPNVMRAVHVGPIRKFEPLARQLNRSPEIRKRSVKPSRNDKIKTLMKLVDNKMKPKFIDYVKIPSSKD